MSGIQAQNSQVTITLIQPPPNQMKIEDMWNLTIFNAQGMNVIFKGSVEEKTAGLIADGSSSSVQITTAFHRLSSSEVQPVTSHVYIKRYEDIMRQTGTPPDGDYTICVTAYDVRTNKELARNCVEQQIRNGSMFELTFPTNGSTLKEKNPVFQWAPVVSSEIVSYKLQIFEVVDNQSIMEPIEANPLFFQRDNIRSPYYQWPIDAKQQFSANKYYVWRIIGYSRNNTWTSEVWGFNINPNQCEANIDSVHVICDGKDSQGVTKYKVTVFFSDLITVNTCNCFLGEVTHVGYGGAFKPNSDYLQVVAGSATIINPSPAQPLTAAYTVTNGQLTPPITFDISNIVLPLTIQINYGCVCGNDACASPPTWEIKSLPDCGCCDNFIRKVDSLRVHMDSASNYCIHGRITAGPNPICKIQAEIVTFSYNVFSINNPPNGSNYCPDCVWPSSKFGNFTNPVPSIGCLSPALTLTSPYTYSREIIWKGNQCHINNVPFHFPVILPDINPLIHCCQDSIKMCIRFSFTDSACVTCDTVICFRFSRNPLSPLHIGYNPRGESDQPYYYLKPEDTLLGELLLPKKPVEAILPSENQKPTAR